MEVNDTGQRSPNFAAEAGRSELFQGDMRIGSAALDRAPSVGPKPRIEQGVLDAHVLPFGAPHSQIVILPGQRWRTVPDRASRSSFQAGEPKQQSTYCQFSWVDLGQFGSWSFIAILDWPRNIVVSRFGIDLETDDELSGDNGLLGPS